MDLLKCVRYSHLEHKQLVKLVSDPVFLLGKDFVRFFRHRVGRFCRDSLFVSTSTRRPKRTTS